MGCGTHSYGNITKQKVDEILQALRSDGAVITGNNPWDVDTKHSGVKLKGEWTEATLTLNITVTDSAFYAPCQKIWDKIDNMMHHIQGLPDSALPK
ncbi:MAG: hypothetical protein HQK99_02985 [Nitrospirae bacterium]|nr:hypothetical protein [Nitrospirota bacterium]